NSFKYQCTLFKFQPDNVLKVPFNDDYPLWCYFVIVREIKSKSSQLNANYSKQNTIKGKSLNSCSPHWYFLI
ncbi:hypothetical protein J3U35_02475, partial [Gilliamella sp. B2717]|uniref:hypothetical protein n=1 Tax=Gilliamella sp. B2717 TaxID=2817996 RepID=UPI00226AC4D4